MIAGTLAEGKQQIFLIPNGTFFVELIIFAIVLYVLWKVILPPIQKALSDRHDTAQKTIDDNTAATKKLKASDERYREALAEARVESTRIRDEARATGQRVLDDLRAQAHSEAEEIRRRGEEQLAEQRQRVLADLHSEVGGLATTLANRVLTDDVTASSRYRGTVDEFVGPLGAGANGKGGST